MVGGKLSALQLQVVTGELGIDFSGSYLHHEAQPGFCVKPVQASSPGLWTGTCAGASVPALDHLSCAARGPIGVLLSCFLVELK